MALIGLMITRNDDCVFETWCADQLHLYDAVVCLDGSTNDLTSRIAERFSDRLIYLHERDYQIRQKTDHGLRQVVHEEIRNRFGGDNWIMCCHADEFCYHDPRKIVALAERTGCELVSWYSPEFYPHPTELADWNERRTWRVTERHRYYHWAHVNTQLPWIEDRLYRDRGDIFWDDSTHGSVRPHGVQREALFHPILRHFKVVAADTGWCEVIGDATYYAHHWQRLEHRTGVPFKVDRFEDLFVTQIPKYLACDRYEGVFDQPWNMGEEFRPNLPQSEENSIPSRLSPIESSSAQRFRVALGPEAPEFGSWQWLGADLAKELAGDCEVSRFQEEIPPADVVIFFKFLPDLQTLQLLRTRSAVIFCPVDVYESAAEIDSDERLRQCHRIVVHCHRLSPYFQSYAPTTYLDHHLKYSLPTRKDVVLTGPLLWVGEQSNLPPVVGWLNQREVSEEIVLLTNLPETTKPTELGLNSRTQCRIARWSPKSHLNMLAHCRCAFDIKGSAFRSRNKPPAKALDFLASGIPFAINKDSSAADHLHSLGFDCVDPNNTDRWLSAEYALECQAFGRRLAQGLSLRGSAAQWREVIASATIASSCIQQAVNSC